MGKGITIFLLLLLGSFVFTIYAQSEKKSDSTKLTNDTIINNSSLLKDRRTEKSMRRPLSPELLTDSVEFETIAIDTINLKKAEFKPNSKKAVLYSVIFPGLGQIYNRKYWKLPLVYGGVLGFAYGITWNGGMYNDYSEAYKGAVTGSNDKWKDLVSSQYAGYTIAPADIQSSLNRKKNFYRRNRDLAIIGSVLFYGLCILDAYVDAELYDFDVSPDLSMQIQPVIFQPTAYSRTGVGLQCSIYF